MKDVILLKNNLIEVCKSSGGEVAAKESFATVCANLAYYGYVLSKKAIRRVATLDEAALSEWWSNFEPVLKSVTGDDKNIGDFVVYKNFPEEVLEKTTAEYWISQICMYVGMPNEWFAEEAKDRELLLEGVKLKVLDLAYTDSLTNIGNGILASVSKWTADQSEEAYYLVAEGYCELNVSKISFKENMATLVARMVARGGSVEMKSATDVLRFAIVISNGDVSMKSNTPFKNFTRNERRFLLNLLNNTTDLEGDMVRDQNKWKNFIRRLHPNDYGVRYEKVCQAYDKLYNGKLYSFNAMVESNLENMNPSVLTALSKRPGEFMRRFQYCHEIFGDEATDAFIKVLPKFTTYQLLSFKRHICTINERKFRTIAPKGNWTKLQVLENTKSLDKSTVLLLLIAIDGVLTEKMAQHFGKSVKLSERADLIKLKTNDVELTDFGRGTVFPIPEEVNYIRSASYWKIDNQSCVWYDNGWNFFDSNWKNIGTCSWNENTYPLPKVWGEKAKDAAAVFSGDPTNNKEMEGRACQMIDLYLDKLGDKGVRYAVWNVLCYSKKSFDSAEEVFAALQWGENPQQGKLFEPSRCQLSFPLRGANFTKYIAYIDVAERKLVYMDANLYGNVSSASANGLELEKKMPAFLEYLDNIPTVYDLFECCPQSEDGVVVDYDDSEHDIQHRAPAYIFRPVNESNSFDQVDIQNLLGQ